MVTTHKMELSDACQTLCQKKVELWFVYPCCAVTNKNAGFIATIYCVGRGKALSICAAETIPAAALVSLQLTTSHSPVLQCRDLNSLAVTLTSPPSAQHSQHTFCIKS